MSDLLIIAEALGGYGVEVKNRQYVYVSVSTHPYDDHEIKIYETKAMVCFKRLIDLHEPDSTNRIAKMVQHCADHWTRDAKGCLTCPT
jgi:hypothetical protein